jgi:hypothetical protein
MLKRSEKLSSFHLFFIIEQITRCVYQAEKVFREVFAKTRPVYTILNLFYMLRNPLPATCR